MQDNFDHVESPYLRNVLQGDVSEDAICQALTMTAQALSEDARNEEIPDKVLDARAAALDYAETAWNDEGDMLDALEGLKRFWMV